MELPEGWEVKTLGEVCQLITRGISPKYLDNGGMMVLNQKCIRDNQIDLSQSRFHDSVQKKVSSERLVHKGDVLINSTGTGTLGRVAQVKESLNNVTVDSHVTIARAKEDLFIDAFFGWAFVAIEEEIKLGGDGCGGQTELSRTKLRDEYSIGYPVSKEEQVQIVNLLEKSFNSIDRAKANLEKNLQNAKDLFQSELNRIFSEKGEDRKEVTFADICKIVGGSQPPKKDFIFHSQEGYIRLVQVRDYRTDKFRTYIPIEKAKRFCSTDDIMIGRYGPPIFGIFRGIEGSYNVALMKALPNEKIIIKEFLYWFLQSNDLVSFVEHSSKRAAGQDGVRVDLLNQYKLDLPTLEDQQKFVGVISEVKRNTDELQSHYTQKLKNLEELKKSILQKAFTGQLTQKEIPA